VFLSFPILLFSLLCPVWPVAFNGTGFDNYYGSREYNSDLSRPGGPMTQYTLTPPADVTNVSANTFALYGDLNSVDSVYHSLVSDCGVTKTFSSDFTQSLTSNFTINPNQTVQYYRASSFALLLNGYDNKQPNITVMDDPDIYVPTYVYGPLAPLPSSMNTTYLICLMSSIARHLPLIDPKSVDVTSGPTSNDADNVDVAHVAGLNVLLLLPALFLAFIINVL
jgi:hypothetical protein